MDNSTETEVRSLDDLIIKLCDIILTNNDNLSREKAKDFILSLSKEDLNLLKVNGFDNRQKVRELVLISVLMYLSDYRNEGDANKTSPFDFVEGGVDYTAYCIDFQEMFRAIHGCRLPDPIKYVLNHIQDIADYFRIFDVFFEIKNNQTAEALLKNVEKTVEEKTYEKAEKIAKTETEKITNKVVQKKVNEAITGKMHTVTEKISETSVTILGIFSGIVLTIVAGLFYSSSVLESVSSTNLHKLFIIATVVGFVCINIIAIMFDYITKIRTGGKSETTEIKKSSEPFIASKDRLLTYYELMMEKLTNKPVRKESWIKRLLEHAKKHLFVIIIDFILIVMMIISTIMYKFDKDTIPDQPTQQENHISVDLNVDGMKDDNGNEIDPSPTASSENPTPMEGMLLEQQEEGAEEGVLSDDKQDEGEPDFVQQEEKQ